MKNIFFIPTVTCLTHWLKRTGFVDIRCVDVSRTTLTEQRKTDWIDTESLADYLDPEDSEKTEEIKNEDAAEESEKPEIKKEQETEDEKANIEKVR